ncbi:MAG: hypothetical protein AAF843_09715 [Bacteroidota bacterium]
MLNRSLYTLALIAILALISWHGFHHEGSSNKILGINTVAPPNSIGKEAFKSLQATGATWLSVIPYSFLKPKEAKVTFDHDGQWWGEGITGASKTVQMAQELGYKVMLKPHIWIIDQGWAGDYEPQSEEQWQKWENSYTNYILTYARIADSLNVSLFCVGTEFRKTVVKKPAYWRSLIKQVREVYQGKVTYAANWDNYERVTFWDDLDFIGIDAYFPVSSEKTPSLTSIAKGWDQHALGMENLSKKYAKPIIFTEYGYRSIDYTADGHWKYNRDTLETNYQAQTNAYQGLYSAIWDKTWFRGGFLWKWHLQVPWRKDRLIKEFTPQNKPVIKVIQKQYAKNPGQD